MRIHEFQQKVLAWCLECFGGGATYSKSERCHRFIEEAVELAQACQISKGDVLLLVDYVYGRPVGEVHQEAGGVVLTLSALCSSYDIDLEWASGEELGRAERNIEKIRAKQAAKPPMSVLPGPSQEGVI